MDDRLNELIVDGKEEEERGPLFILGIEMCASAEPTIHLFFLSPKRS